MPNTVEQTSIDTKRMTFEGEVVRWVDGDTVDLRLDLGFSIYSKQRIRLAGINTPEKNQPNYVEARKKAEELAPVGVGVKLTCHGKDRYGRWIGDVVNGVENVNQAILKSGLAVVYKE